MIKMIITDAVVSKGFDQKPAIRFVDCENGLQIAAFRIGKRVYDSRAEDNHRWINLSVKGYGELSERIKKMKLKEGSFINLIGRYDEETWTDKETGEKRTAPVLILDEIEYCFNGGNSQKNGQGTAGKSGSGTGVPTPEASAYPPVPQGYPPAPLGAPQVPTGTAPPAAPPMPENFTGFEGFGGQQNPYF